MHLSQLTRQAVTLLFFVIIGTTIIMADTTHVINRGETLQSIAMKYGVTTEQIIKANPQAAKFIYVGMELKIPMASLETRTETTPVKKYTDTSSSTDVLTTNAPQSSGNVFSDSPVISQKGIDYVADFVNGGKGYYGLFFEIIGKSGWGGLFSVGANYGIVKPGQLHFRLGPDYGYRMGESLVLSVPVVFTITTVNNETESTINNNSIKVTKTEMKTLLGLSATPKIAFKIENVYLNLGIDINYIFKRKMATSVGFINYGGKVHTGFFVGIGL